VQQYKATPSYRAAADSTGFPTTRSTKSRALSIWITCGELGLAAMIALMSAGLTAP